MSLVEYVILAKCPWLSSFFLVNVLDSSLILVGCVLFLRISWDEFAVFVERKMSLVDSVVICRRSLQEVEDGGGGDDAQPVRLYLPHPRQVANQSRTVQPTAIQITTIQPKTIQSMTIQTTTNKPPTIPATDHPTTNHLSTDHPTTDHLHCKYRPYNHQASWHRSSDPPIT
jgi:hypothetical protein